MQEVFSAVKLPPQAEHLLRTANATVTQWSAQEGEFTISEADLLEQATDATILISAVNVPVTAKYIQSSPNLKLITNIGDGFDNIAIGEAKARNILVTNAPTLDSVASTAEQTVTLALALSRQILPDAAIMHADDFPGWSVTGYVGGHQLYGKNVTIIGLGRIGKIVAQMLSGFNTKISYVDPVSAPEDFEKKYSLTHVSLPEGLKTADYVTINCTLNKSTELLIGEHELQQMKNSAYLINCARGGLVDEAALLNALNAGEIAGAAIDTPQHAPHISTALTALPNFIATPHAGNATYEARNEMALDAVNNILRYLKGEELLYRVL